MKILFLSHTSIDTDFRVGSHHLSRELVRAGHDVWHISTPVTPKSFLRRQESDRFGMWVDEDGVKHWKPHVFIPMHRAKNVAMLWRQVTVRELDVADVVIVDQPLMSGLAARFGRSFIVYRPTDIVGTDVLRRRQTEVLSVADAVVATSSAVLEELALPPSFPTLLLANGVDTEHFRRREEVVRRAGFVYVGSLSARFDWEAIEVLSQAFPDEPIDIFGPVLGVPPQMAETVRLLGALDYDLLPATLQRYRVGLLPLSSVRINQGRSPMKFYEYSAAGLAVLARRTPSLVTDFSLDSTSHAFGYDSHSDLVEVARQALAHPVPDTDAIALAADQSWSSKARILERFIMSGLQSSRREVEVR